jgi:hypothetical protein
MAKVKAVDVNQLKSYKKELGIGLVNLVLAGISIFVFDYWFELVSQLPALQMAENFGVVVLGGLTLFVGKTFYGKGTINNMKKIFYTTALAVATVALMLYTALTLSIFYPLSGAVLVFITFYMLSLSAATMNLVGIIAMAMIFGTGIAYMNIKDYIGWEMTGTLTKVAMFLILFIGGVWPHFRRWMHGVTGVNKDGGGFGSDDSEGGDEDDGDGDTGDE